ncbi:SDR family NAD(P)-dependent oxidoreductase [Hahella aquimaris]|uniref:SDR family NAD(P)-dependent oxidoreductase n=1 Tax=Hahella sp. HNIBRBA332 TaxID=3015983 RepID=UPI00273C3218|nr:SDR family NAD(P)-dependent oxidoreductase [Hahella sp. HNIBRBA332]WLQ11362.1 SDR family NAD(P)-dependent oxidoreductase [Hahella sp. HNIBRBA332]
MSKPENNSSKVALVTGASVGLGEAIAERLAHEGYDLILLARRQDKLEALAARLQTNCHIIACDICDQQAVTAAIENLPPAFAAIDLLINNAGLALGLGPAQSASWEDWSRMIEVNCTGLAFMTHLLLPSMVERNAGHIINIGSIAGSYAYFGGNVYGATKAFVEQFSRNLKADLLGTALRVTNIEPGMVGGSEFSLVRFKGDEDKAKATYENADALTPENIADCVAWAATRPANVNINRIEVMPVCQAPERLAIHRNKSEG